MFSSPVRVDVRQRRSNTEAKREIERQMVEEIEDMLEFEAELDELFGDEDYDEDFLLMF